MSLEQSAPEVAMPAPRVVERPAHHLPGVPLLLAALAALVAGVVLAVAGGQADSSAVSGTSVVVGLLVAAVGLVTLGGLVQVSPGQARVVQLFGHYSGTIRTQGLRWVNPLTKRSRVSTRIRNLQSDVAKVNDVEGTPIEMAVVVVWQVEDTAQALFEVDDFVRFVSIQTDSAVRHIANGYPYDSSDPQRLSLRDNADEITERLSAEIQARVASAGVHVVESRITHLAYAPEIASAMLRRQQAGAVVAARQRIVEGAVGMVQMALDKLAAEQVVELDEERKAAMVSNLLVVLCGDRDATPVVNTGSLYA
ncbi:SPFH domain/Band 7 family protein [Motilibacter rhizosphaerae]|uniref:SPFH domain/Band 7 family protein n=1 Tax=Motilibacter rhizosphaerae TaxID=598652 RepID=A0A4Q7NR85_9ACTN|nr:SPFH domain-containing protein [Motilibacter rhizosphaerae]RZS89485.1 SPFH domain/Band 7 family protein [Motilibacter rhizosphaerae]